MSKHHQHRILATLRDTVLPKLQSGQINTTNIL